MKYVLQGSVGKPQTSINGQMVKSELSAVSLVPTNENSAGAVPPETAMETLSAAPRSKSLRVEALEAAYSLWDPLAVLRLFFFYFFEEKFSK
ncbi:hypothetical protein JTE90_006676 [Oedothorax gibbosus]|uniref:Uncharacterized protein n=1 Tax=Oedothorax gibbosus TaxID=931172 RepID=A0AAV6V1K1_9ARAC|nr:hypothetical protein JTE90_006676 [Oedothorax gibbosus]